MDPISLNCSSNGDIWSSSSPKYFQPAIGKSRPSSSSFSEFTRQDVLANDLPEHVGRRSRLHSMPAGSRIKQSVPQQKLDIVDDVFSSDATTAITCAPTFVPLSTGLSNNCDLSPFPTSQPILSTELKPAIQKPTASVGWLEVSIDSTLPSSPAGINKNVFDLSPLDTELPDWKPSATVMTKRLSPPKSTFTTGCSLVKRLLPEPLSSKMYSRKVFIGGLPPDIDQNEIRLSFEQYGPLTVDWPHKVHSKSNVPPKGYAFLLFKDEHSVHKLLTNCFSEGEKLFTHVKYMTSGTLTRKKVQMRPWRVSDSFYMAESGLPGDSRKAIFVGGVPRPLKASELAEIMSEKFGPVTFIAIDCDSDLKYPKGAACVIFATHTSYIAAVSSRFMQLVFGAIEKKVELKPYILDDQLCDECKGTQSNGQPAPFFCGSVTCLKYYCEHCWGTFHSFAGRNSHRPLFKDVFDREKFC